MAVRTRIRRKRRRKAPAVKRGTNGSQTQQCTDKQSSGLLIGGAHDPAEKAADSLAARALGQPVNTFGTTLQAPAPVIQRKCAACEAREKGETVSRQATSPVTAPGTRAAPATATATQAITSLGAGRPMSKHERGFFEPRFGADFSQVRLHDGPQATRAADSIQAEAFTHGKNIALGRTQDPVGTMAHELAHVVQGGGALRRKMIVEKPKAQFPGSPKASKMTNASGLVDLIKQFPGAPKVSVDGSGNVSLPADFCDKKDPSKPASKDYPVSHGCLCQIVASKNDWNVQFFYHQPQGPRTYALGGDKGSPDKSQGGTVHMNTPYSKQEYGFFKADGTVETAKNWTIFAHEMCGHAAKKDRNDHPEEKSAKLRHGHDEVVPITNEIRKEKMKENKKNGILGNDLELRPETAAAPNCGESTVRDRGSKAKWTPSSNLALHCQNKRNKYIDGLKTTAKEKARLKKIALDKPLK